MRRRWLDALGRARAELDLVSHELELAPEDDPEEDGDLVEVRSRVDALEARVAAIEERGPA